MSAKRYLAKGLQPDSANTPKKLAKVPTLVQEFPYKKDWLDPKDMMENLKRFEGWSQCTNSTPWNIRFQAKRGNQLLFPVECRIRFQHHDEDYHPRDALGDYFTEEQRLQAQRKDAERPPLEEWAQPGFRERAVRAVFEKNLPLTPQTLRDAVYELTKEATQFKPPLMVAAAR